MPKITGIGQLLLKLSLVVGRYPFFETQCTLLGVRIFWPGWSWDLVLPATTNQLPECLWQCVTWNLRSDKCFFKCI